MRLMSGLLLALGVTGASVAWAALVVTAVGPMSQLRQEVVRQTWRDAPEIDHDLPVSLTCPITTELLRYPVVASDGITYEWSAVKKWYVQIGGSLAVSSTAQAEPPTGA